MRVALTTGVIPVPVRPTGEPVTPTLAVMVAVPVEAPTAVGEKTTLMVQVAPPPASVAAQVPPAAPAGLENGAVTTTVIPVKVAVPVLCRVRVCAVLVVPTTSYRMRAGPPVTLAIAVVPPATNSTAPASTKLLVFLAFP